MTRQPGRRTGTWIVSLTILTGTLGTSSYAGVGEVTRGPTVVTLGKTTRFLATHHSQVKVRRPEDVSLRDMKSRIDGGGRVAGYALTDWTQDPEQGSVLVQSFIMNRCLEPGCPPAEQPLRIRWAEGVKNGTIPAGTYRLYVVADEAPVVVTFRDPHLRGSYTARLEGEPVGVDLRTLPMSSTSTSDGTVFSAGDFTSLDPGRGLGLLGLWALGSPYAAGAFGNCFYFDETLAPRRDTAFVPGCPAGWSPSRYPAIPAPPGEEGGLIYTSTHHRLPLGIGGWAASGATLKSFGAVGLWLRWS